MLVNPEEQLPPSDKKALKKFIQAGNELGVDVEVITQRNFLRLPEYDGLFIRETTNVNHRTYRFARRADAEGLVVIDDPGSILRCTNKVYLHELLRRHRVATPATTIVTRDKLRTLARDVAARDLTRQRLEVYYQQSRRYWQELAGAASPGIACCTACRLSSPLSTWPSGPM